MKIIIYRYSIIKTPSIIPTESITPQIVNVETNNVLLNDNNTAEGRAVVNLDVGIWQVPITTYVDYTLPQNKIDKKYFKGICIEMNRHQSNSNYLITQSRRNINIKRGNTIIFKCSKVGVAPRNLYLELCGANFDLAEWEVKRARGDYNGFGYESATGTPPFIN